MTDATIEAVEPTDVTPVALTPGRAALILLALSVGSFGLGTGEFAIMGLLPDIAAGFGVSVPGAGHLISAYALGVVIGAPSIALLAARLSRRTLLLLLMLGFGLGNLARLRTHCQSQKMTVAAMQMAEKKVWAHRS